MSKQVECVKYGSHRQGSLRKLADSDQWISCYHVNGKEHRESTKTSDFKAARRFDKQRNVLPLNNAGNLTASKC